MTAAVRSLNSAIKHFEDLDVPLVCFLNSHGQPRVFQTGAAASLVVDNESLDTVLDQMQDLVENGNPREELPGDVEEQHIHEVSIINLD